MISSVVEVKAVHGVFWKNFELLWMIRHPPFSSTAVKHEPFLLTPKKTKAWRFSIPSALGNSPAYPTWNTRPTTGCGARSTSLWVHRNRFWQLPRDGNLNGSGMSHATTASPKPFFRAPWRVGDSVVGRGSDGQTSKSVHPCPCQTCLQGPLAEKTGRNLR